MIWRDDVAGCQSCHHIMQNGEQIVSKEWVEQSSQNKVKLLAFDGYGYLWWKQAFINDIETYFADGNGGQQKSRVRGDSQARFCENLRVKLPWVTRLCAIPPLAG